MFRKIAELIFRRRNAYRAIFLPGGQVGVAANIVLSDLKQFCRADRSTMVVSMVSQRIDPVASAILEGRREVWLRIMNHLHISDADLFGINDPEGQPQNEAGDED
jgi:hypothetical protein